jgi:hypothetical protein
MLRILTELSKTAECWGVSRKRSFAGLSKVALLHVLWCTVDMCAVFSLGTPELIAIRINTEFNLICRGYKVEGSLHWGYANRKEMSRTAVLEKCVV